jgi:hypothetical protein
MAAANSKPMASGKLIKPAPHMAPTMNNSESPGKNGMTTTPVSTKMIKNNKAYTQAPYCATKDSKCRSTWRMKSTSCKRMSITQLSPAQPRKQTP